MRTVKNILDQKSKPKNIVSPDLLVIDALRELSAVNLSYLVVMKADEYLGVFSERDYSRNLVLKGKSSSSTSVSEVMTRDLPVVGYTDTAETCMTIMTAHKARYLVAKDPDENFAGVITIHDLLRLVIADKEDVFDSGVAQQLIDHDESGDIY